MTGVDDEVRRRLQDRLRDAGVAERSVALEVIWWMPRGFVDAYQELFLRCFKMNDGGNVGGGDVGKAKGKQKDRGMPGAKAGGKKYKGDTWVIKDERALEVKKRVDRRLEQIVQRNWSALAKELGGVGDRTGLNGEAGKLVEASQGSIPGWVEGMDRRMLRSGGEGMLVDMPGTDGKKKQCRDCGRIAKGEWVRCPYPHA